MPGRPADVRGSQVGRTAHRQGTAGASGLQLVFCRDTSVYDGRFANISWLQECPDPLTKLTWDNAALISPATARELNVTSQRLVTLQIGDRSLEIPAYVMPGQADGR